MSKKLTIKDLEKNCLPKAKKEKIKGGIGAFFGKVNWGLAIVIA